MNSFFHFMGSDGISGMHHSLHCRNEHYTMNEKNKIYIVGKISISWNFKHVNETLTTKKQRKII